VKGVSLLGVISGRWLTNNDRAFAINNRLTLSLDTKLKFNINPVDLFNQDKYSISTGIIVQNEKEAGTMRSLAIRIHQFGLIDEDTVSCWGGHCQAQTRGCDKFNSTKVLAIHQELFRISIGSTSDEPPSQTGNAETEKINSSSFRGFLSDTQYIDIIMNHMWLKSRLWLLSMRHGILTSGSPRKEVSLEYGSILGLETLRRCQSVPINALEWHGLGMVCFPLKPYQNMVLLK
jgi:hypothetical protein